MDHEDHRAGPVWLNAAGVRARLAAMALLADLLERSARISAAAVAAAAAGDPDGWLVPGTERSAVAAQRVQAQVAELRALLRDTEATLQTIEQAARQPLPLALEPGGDPLAATQPLGGSRTLELRPALDLAELGQRIDQSPTLTAARRAALRRQLDQYAALIRSGTIDPAARPAVDQALAALLAALRTQAQARGATLEADPALAAGMGRMAVPLSRTLLGMAGTLTAAGGALAADDVSGVGLVNDPAIPVVLGLAALLGLAGLAARTLEVTPEETDAATARALDTATAALAVALHATSRAQTAEDLGIDLDQLEVDPNSRPGLVYRPSGHKTDQREVEVADTVAEHEGRAVVLTGRRPGEYDSPAIDGFFNDTGELIQIKHLPSADDSKIVERVNHTYEQAKRQGYTGVQIYIDAPNMTQEVIERRWNGQNRRPSRKDHNDGTLDGVWVYPQGGGKIKLPLNR